MQGPLQNRLPCSCCVKWFLGDNGHFLFPFARIVGFLDGEGRGQGLAASAVGAQRRALTAAAAGRIEDHPGEGNLHRSEPDFWLWLPCAVLPSALSVGRIVRPGACKGSSCRGGCCYLQCGLSMRLLLAPTRTCRFFAVTRTRPQFDPAPKRSSVSRYGTSPFVSVLLVPTLCRHRHDYAACEIPCNGS